MKYIINSHILLALLLMIPSYSNAVDSSIKCSQVKELFEKHGQQRENDQHSKQEIIVEIKNPEIKAIVSSEKNSKDVYDYLPTVLAIITVITTMIISLKSMENTRDISKDTIINQNTLFLAQKRQEWINSLRNILSNLLGIYSNLTHNLMMKRIGQSKDFKIDPKDIVDLATKLDGKLAHLELFLNFKERQHRVLIHTGKRLDKKIREMIKKDNDIDKTLANIKILKTSFTLQSQKILKREWDRVKDFGNT